MNGNATPLSIWAIQKARREEVAKPKRKEYDIDTNKKSKRFNFIRMLLVFHFEYASHKYENLKTIYKSVLVPIEPRWKRSIFFALHHILTVPSLSHIRVYNPNGRALRDIELPEYLERAHLEPKHKNALEGYDLSLVCAQLFVYDYLIEFWRLCESPSLVFLGL